MVFRSNPGFVFHDSQGFEAGGIKEFEEMKSFVTERAKTTFLKKRIHAIWYTDVTAPHSIKLKSMSH